MGNANVIREFLVSIGYTLDEQGERRVIDGIGKVTKAALGLEAAILAAAAAVAGAVAKMADGLEDLYFASQRTGASVGNIQALGAAATQLGGSVAGARASLEAFANFIRSSPGALSWIQSLGVQVRDARTGMMRDTSDIMQDLGKQFSQMPIWRAQAYAQFLGIDQNTLRALMQGVDGFEAEYRRMVRAVGLDSDQAARDAHEFMVSLRNGWNGVSIIVQKVGANLYKSFGADIERLRQLVIGNSARIVSTIEWVAKGIIWLADAAFRMASRAVEAGNQIVEWFNSLDKSAQRGIEALGGLLVAWRLLNAGFLATPLGAITALSAGLLLLYDDYKVWQEGGKSLIDWSRWQDEIAKAQALLGGFGDHLAGWWAGMEKDGAAFVAWLDDVFAGRWDAVLAGITGEMTDFYERDLKRIFAAIEDVFSDFASWVGSAFADAFKLAVDKVWSLVKPVFDLINGAFDTAKSAAQWVIDQFPSVGQQQIPEGAGALLGSLYNPAAGSDRLGSGSGARCGGLQGENSLKVRHALAYYQRQGWSLAQAAGIVANLYQESALDPTAVGDNGAAMGLAQWHRDRREAIERQFGKRLADMSFEEQLAAVDWELRQGGETRAGQLLAGATTAAQAGDIVSRHYERPLHRDAEALSRAAMANSMMLDQTRNFAPGAAVIAGAAPITVNQNTNVNVTGTSQPQETARAVTDALHRRDQDMVRNLSGAVQ